MTEQEYYIDPIMKEQLDRIKARVLKKDRDWLGLVDGEEGTGKSVLTQQMAKYLDPNFNLDNIVFTGEQFIERIKSAKKGECIVLDEGFNAVNSRATMSNINRAMVGLATEMRQANLFVFIVLPSFFDLDRYFAVWRSRCLIHVYEGKDQSLGHYRVWPKHKKLKLYMMGKKNYYSYKVPKSPYPPMSFPKHYTVDEMLYREKKAIAFRKREVSTMEQRYLKYLSLLVNYCVEKGMTKVELANAVKLDEKMIRNFSKNSENKENLTVGIAE